MKVVNIKEQGDKIFLDFKNILNRSCAGKEAIAPSSDKVKGKCHASRLMWRQETKGRIAWSGLIVQQLLWVVLAVPLQFCSAEFRGAQRCLSGKEGEARDTDICRYH